ncbi:odorant receptor 67c-like [Euwallacea fornicatus]|uniref:odorant receptor 67c-like n=1 Tax=Euwallacea fornicatus TaxID=995702 RepID=UPI00338EFBCB
MIIFPQCENLRTAIRSCFMMGILPLKLPFPENKKMQRAYAIYSKIIFYYFFAFIITAYIELFLVLNESPIRKDMMSLNLCVTLIYTLTFARRAIVEFSPSFQKMIYNIIEDEAKGDPIDDELIQKLDKKRIDDTNWKFRIYVYFIISVCLLYLIKPVLMGPIEETYENVTRTVRMLPISSWFPFDAQEHYKFAYISHSITCMIGGPTVLAVDLLLSSLIAYPYRQLIKLDYFLKNFQNFKRKYQTLNAIEDEEKASFFFFKYLINKHKNIIRYVNTYNKNMAYSMVFDFIQSSVQIATILTQVLGNEISLMLIVSIFVFWVTMVMRIFLYYYYANELLNMSQKLAYSIWESNWPDEGPKIKFMVFMFIMRTQKPLAFKIGPFSQMSLMSFISVLKATYSYVMLILT